MTADASASFESVVSALTAPLNGQYPRPWMTDLTDPLSAKVLIVGRNQATPYDTTKLTHQRHMDALFNRNGESCRGIYSELVGKSTRTRQNIDRLRELLQQADVNEVLETNVICYSTPMSADLAQSKHIGGTAKGTEIFGFLLERIEPPVLIAHGAGTIGDLSDIVGVKLPTPRQELGKPVTVKVGNTTIIVVQSLAPSKWWQWHEWAWQHLELVAEKAAMLVK